MHDSLGVGRLQRGRNLLGQLHGLLGRVRTLEGAAFDVLQHQVVGTDVVNLADVRMIERGDRAGLLREATGVLGGEPLDGDAAVQTGVVGFPHFAHAAGADARDEFVRPHRVADGPLHGSIVSGGLK